MKSNFDYCLNEVLKSEGGYTNDPSDNGGATNFGITLDDYRKYLNKNGTPNDVKNMTVDQAKKIYKSHYWDSLGCDNLSSGVDYTVFDYGVNSGLQRPRKALDKFKSLEGDKLIDAINDERTAFLTTISNPNNPKYAHNFKFRNGWFSRVNRVRASSHYLASQKTDKASGPVAGTIAGLSLGSIFYNYIHNHPYVSVAVAIATGAAVWGLVHYIRNRNK